ncbi:hypothetical protein [Pleionea sp. CnH1-48]|uniref:hypothetical protein n=1 Tax=Pleionea sp. CnH1-48 TaxID=2954494 RepID=UPI00209700FB|nr:hypothetical protein [Pleionea sp. CnH1-48]MCO7225989.1 hypothetical protein [Pleionea sp. CnH1-48]
MFRVILLMLVMWTSECLWATAQVPDTLLFQGKTHDLHVNPLSRFFEENPELKPESEVTVTSNWRGYEATFSIVNDQLYVNDITVLRKGFFKWNDIRDVSVIRDVFPEKLDRRLKWYSGLLISPKGKVVKYIHGGYASQFERYLLIRVKKGIVTEYAEMTLEQWKTYKQRQFEAYKQTKEYQTLYRDIAAELPSFTDQQVEDAIFQMEGYVQSEELPFKEKGK